MSSDTIRVVGARVHNLKNITVEIPLEQFVCVTGASGSGKSSLIHEILYKRLYSLLHDSRVPSASRTDTVAPHAFGYAEMKGSLAFSATRPVSGRWRA